ncbi:MAG: YeeE/YedE family protein [Acidobacteria bacterium]|nr:YeeE/YedE family protein [Acidobacteriota bacterium]
MTDEKTGVGLWLGLLSLVAVVVPTVVGWRTGAWYLTAIPVGFLFGFLLQKGDLCGSSAMSEVLLFRDARKLAGLWVAIAVSMVGFAAIERLGWVVLKPKPLLWASWIVGGAIFGAGTVLAGGCISGCLYKAGAGNLNSMAALAGMPLGIAMVEHGALSRTHLWLKSHVVKAADGGPVTLSSLTGLPYWLLALVLAGATLAVALWLRRTGTRPAAGEPVLGRLMRRSWPPWQAGIAIGVLAVAAFLSAVASGRSYPLGVTHGVLHAYELASETVKVETGRPAAVPASPPATAAPAPVAPSRKVSAWLILVVVAMVPGSWVAARLSGQAKLLPKPPEQTVTAFFGGILVGVGAGFATGCVVGNILSGWALMSVGMILFGGATLLANWAVTRVYLVGVGGSRS